MIGAYRLPLRFHDAALRAEVAAIEGRADWVDHWVSEPGAWGIIPLLSQTGAHEGRGSIHFTGWTPPRATVVLEGAPRLREVLGTFHTRILHARLSRLAAGKNIARHVHLVTELEVNDWLRSLFPPATFPDRFRGVVLRTFEPALWKLARRLGAVRRHLASRTRNPGKVRAAEQ